MHQQRGIGHAEIIIGEIAGLLVAAGELGDEILEGVEH
jgi:hypothetical protein